MDLQRLNDACKETFIDLLGIEFTGFSETRVEATMQATSAHLQPAGTVHGGALISLAETVGSAGSFLLADPEKFAVFGAVIHSQHLKPAGEGLLKAVARLIVRHDHKHIWDVEIRDGRDQLISISRVTNSVKPKKSEVRGVRP